MTSDFRRFYMLDWPDCMKTHAPGQLLALLDGLTGVDGSLYRAWRMEHRPSRQEDPGDRRLSYVGWGQSQLLQMELVNTIETIRVMLARYMGDKKAKAQFLYPPGVEPDGGNRVRIDQKHMSPRDIINSLRGLFNENAA